MIISHRHKFVFVQVPATASSFLALVFEREFGGEPILGKHAAYEQFLEVATPEQASYRSIIGKRNPLDMVTTRYARRLERNGIRHVSIEETQVDFEGWFRERFITKKARLNHHIPRSYPFVEHAIRQEFLMEDLEAVLRKLDLEMPYVKPWKRRTQGKLHHFTRYYSASLIPDALERFQGEMNLLGYEAPENWRAENRPCKGSPTH